MKSKKLISVLLSGPVAVPVKRKMWRIRKAWKTPPRQMWKAHLAEILK